MEINFEDLKQKYSIIDVAIRLGLPIKAKDTTQAINCIKHDDRNPSMLFYPENNRFECKGCGFKGDIFDLIQEIKKCGIKEAVKWLDPSLQLEAPVKQGQTPREYISLRGLTQETLNKFGFVIKENTIEFPVPGGIKVRNFDKEPKYQNPIGEAKLFKTSEVDNFVILVEGEMDAIKLWQETNLPVWSGTTGATFKDSYVDEFKGLDKVFIGFDNDDAGARGEECAVAKLGKERCFKLPVPFGKDWTEAFQLGMTEADFLRILDNAKSFGSNSLFNVSKDDIVETVKCGFETIDEIIGGFRYGNSYRLGGVDKCGKSSFLMQVATNMMQDGYKVAYINTELTDPEFRTAMTALEFDETKRLIENDLEKQQIWAEKYNSKLFYAGINDMILKQADSLPSFEKTLQKANEFLSKGARIFFFDNLSTFANNAKSDKKGWEILSDNGLKVINFSKLTNSICFFVLHATSGLAYTDTTEAVKKYIAENMPNKIFDDSLSVLKRPNGDSLHGGTVLKGQSSGTILIWRPYQNFEKSPTLPRESAIILESMRHSRSGSLIRMDFDGAKGKFTEDPLNGVWENNK